ncbi:hypothetical protein FRC11_004875, partial [Ceratobasidium sp. 423]
SSEAKGSSQSTRPPRFYMSQELAAAGDHLRSALDRYVRACSNARDACFSGGQLNSSRVLQKCLEKESGDIVSHAQKLEDARAAIHAARNSIPKAARITELPAEILARIFQLTLPGQSCLVRRVYSGTISQIKYPLYPDALAHVCSYWRRVAITTPSIWTHIDIVLDHSLNPGLFARAKVYTSRAGQLPLEIHISNPGSEREGERARDVLEGNRARSNPHKPSEEWDALHEFKIFASSTVSIKSLEMDLRINRHHEIYYSVLEYFFARCKPGVLTKYTVRTSRRFWDTGLFIEPAETPHSLNGALLAVPTGHLDEVWLHISSVRVGALCPHWKTKVYHGLVELYIEEDIPSISESQLVNILRSSPKLQVLHFKTIFDEPNDDGGDDPVYLEDLRELNLMIRDDEGLSVSRILRRITPGSKPLQLSLVDVPRREAADFFSRANVTRFYTWCPFDLSFVISRCRRLEVLVLNERNADTQDLSSILDDDSGDEDENLDGESTPKPVSPSATQIDTLYLLWHSQFTFEQIRAVVEKYSVQRLLIYYGRLSYQTDEGRLVCKNTRNIRVKLSTIVGCTIEYYPDGFCDDYSEGEPDDPEGWIRDAIRS